uniref:CUB domain-containing protein n=1 Tax=Gongylonema pulchrum TaxID=637853 RepID=A0A183CVG0_9BILA
LCGSLAGWNKTFSNGRVFVTFTTDSTGTGKVFTTSLLVKLLHVNFVQGFVLQLTEQLHDCSSDRLVLNEGDPPKILTSPEFPKMSPNSLDCVWMISAPGGHRIKFTVDPTTFDLQDSSLRELCADDYLEIRDGPSKLSPLFGRYCRSEPPSTIYSTGSYLHIRYQTDSFAQSSGWNATYEIASCGGSIVIPVNGSSVLRSPHYPEPYPSQAECDWTVMAPRGHYVNAT